MRLYVPKTFFSIWAALLLVTGCSYFTVNSSVEKPVVKAQPTEKEITFERAEKFFEIGKYDEALPLYLKITRDPPDNDDSIYNRSLLSLAKLYEKSDQSEKAILSLDELSKRNSDILDKASLKVLLIKSHYRVTNYYQARQIRSELDTDYRAQNITLNDLYNALYYQTTLHYDRHIFDELLFLGDMQKYFVYVMESNMTVEAEKLTELLMLYYERFILQLNNAVLSPDVKKKLIISLLDQLGKFDRYKLDNPEGSVHHLNRFSSFADLHQKKLTERLTNGNY